MVTVACVRVGEAFGVEYVEHLHDMVRRNLPEGFAGRFVCLTDRPKDLRGLPGVEPIDIAALSLHGWWAKMALFRPDLFAPGERIWYFDLDTVITGPLEEIFKYSGAFAILEDVCRPGGFQSSVMSFIRGNLSASIWELWESHGMPTPDGGDQSILEIVWRAWLPDSLNIAPHLLWHPDMLQRAFPGAFRSYKAECQFSIPSGTKVVFFHGLPRPHDIIAGWVPQVWKVGGGSQVELVMVGTVAQEIVLKNIQVALTRGYEELKQTGAHGKTAVVCAGGPSLEAQIPLIANLSAAGADVFALNNVDGYLRKRGIKAPYHVMMDARPELHDWVHTGGVKLYASMCDPSVLNAGSAHGDLLIWHPFTQGATDLLPNKPLIGGGSTVGTRALALCWFMGYRQISVFGMDSCYGKGDRHHAYDQPLNDGEQVYDVLVGGQRYRAAAWMVNQVKEFEELAARLSSTNTHISIFGDGLLSAKIRSLVPQGSAA